MNNNPITAIVEEVGRQFTAPLNVQADRLQTKADRLLGRVLVMAVASVVAAVSTVATFAIVLWKLVL